MKITYNTLKKDGTKSYWTKVQYRNLYFIHEVVHMMKQACEGHSEPYTFTLDDPKHLHNTLQEHACQACQAESVN